MALGAIFCKGTTPGVFSTNCEITSLIAVESSSERKGMTPFNFHSPKLIVNFQNLLNSLLF